MKISMKINEANLNNKNKLLRNKDNSSEQPFNKLIQKAFLKKPTARELSNDGFGRCTINEEESNQDEPVYYACHRVSRSPLFSDEVPKDMAGMLFYGHKDELPEHIFFEVKNCEKDNQAQKHKIPLKELNLGKGIGDSGYMIPEKIWAKCTLKDILQRTDVNKDLEMTTNITHKTHLGNDRFVFKLRDSRKNLIPDILIGLSIVLGGALVIYIICKLKTCLNERNKKIQNETNPNTNRNELPNSTQSQNDASILVDVDESDESDELDKVNNDKKNRYVHPFEIDMEKNPLYT